MGAAGHQGAIGALALCPVGTHLHLVVTIWVQVGELHRGYLAVKQVGFGLRVTLDPVLDLPPGRNGSVGSSKGQSHPSLHGPPALVVPVARMRHRGVGDLPGSHSRAGAELGCLLGGQRGHIPGRRANV